MYNLQFDTISFNRPGFKKSLGLGYADSVQNLRFCTVLHPSTPRCYNTFSRLRDN